MSAKMKTHVSERYPGAGSSNNIDITSCLSNYNNKLIKII